MLFCFTASDHPHPYLTYTNPHSIFSNPPVRTQETPKGIINEKTKQTRPDRLLVHPHALNPTKNPTHLKEGPFETRVEETNLARETR